MTTTTYTNVYYVRKDEVKTIPCYHWLTKGCQSKVCVFAHSKEEYCGKLDWRQHCRQIKYKYDLNKCDRRKEVRVFLDKKITQNTYNCKTLRVETTYENYHKSFYDHLRQLSPKYLSN